MFMLFVFSSITIYQSYVMIQINLKSSSVYNHCIISELTFFPSATLQNAFELAFFVWVTVVFLYHFPSLCFHYESNLI
jgi:hypothetical protein